MCVLLCHIRSNKSTVKGLKIWQTREKQEKKNLQKKRKRREIIDEIRVP